MDGGGLMGGGSGGRWRVRRTVAGPVGGGYTCSNRPRFTNAFLLNGQHG